MTKTTSKTHPAILSYPGNKPDNYPVIWVFGREANADQEMLYEVGTYCFSDYPHCALWNTALKLFQITQVNPKPISEIKRFISIEKRSPFIFSDLSPKTIQNKEKNKHIFRAANKDKIPGHLQKCIELAKRQNLQGIQGIIVSGSEVFGKPSELEITLKPLSDYATDKGIFFIRLPFFCCFNQRKIENELPPHGRDFQSVKTALNKFLNWPSR